MFTIINQNTDWISAKFLLLQFHLLVALTQSIEPAALTVGPMI